MERAFAYEEEAEVVEISTEELLQEIDQQARQRLGMSGEEFARQLRLGNLPDTLAVNELRILLNFANEAFIPT